MLFSSKQSHEFLIGYENIYFTEKKSETKFRIEKFIYIVYNVHQNKMEQYRQLVIINADDSIRFRNICDVKTFI